MESHHIISRNATERPVNRVYSPPRICIWRRSPGLLHNELGNADFAGRNYLPVNRRLLPPQPRVSWRLISFLRLPLSFRTIKPLHLCRTSVASDAKMAAMTMNAPPIPNKPAAQGQRTAVYSTQQSGGGQTTQFSNQTSVRSNGAPGVSTSSINFQQQQSNNYQQQQSFSNQTNVQQGNQQVTFLDYDVGSWDKLGFRQVRPYFHFNSKKPNPNFSSQA